MSAFLMFLLNVVLAALMLCVIAGLCFFIVLIWKSTWAELKHIEDVREARDERKGD